jgi:hypothetical protein
VSSWGHEISLYFFGCSDAALFVLWFVSGFIAIKFVSFLFE